MHKNRILCFAAFCLLFFGNAGAEEKTLTLGGKSGWTHIQTMDGVEFGTGRYGYDSIELSTNSRQKDTVTDLLIDFDSKIPIDKAGNYSVVSNNLVHSKNAKMGSGSALSRGNGGLRLSGSKDSLFGSSGDPGSFLIEFWLCPSIAENGEVVFSWRSSRTVRNYPLYQMITASFYNNHLRWEFINVFNDYTANGGEVAISGYRTVIPDVWTHHSISYDEQLGLLEYRINGKLEDLCYVTTNGKESGGDIYTPILGVAADLDICPQYTGSIDDIHIQRSAQSQSATDLRYDAYHKKGGRFETEPLKISRGASLTRVDAELFEPSQTDIMLYVRAGDNYFTWTDTEPEWIPVLNHEQIANVSGLYFQVAGELYPDGAGSQSPSITQVDIHYTEVPPPLPPFTLIAEPGDGQVTLTWSYSVDNQAGGYLLYYGERPGEYLGVEALQGASPIQAGNVAKYTLTGLKNGKIYYFAVATYSGLDEHIVGTLSKEAYARPLRK